MMTLFDKQPTSGHNVLDKLLNVNTDVSQRISDTDIAFCERITRNRDEAIKQLDKWEMLLKADLLENWQGMYDFTDYNNGNISYRQIHTNRERFEQDYFFPGDALETIHQNRKDIANRYSEMIVNYFKATYNLPITEYDYRGMSDYNKIVDKIFEKTESTNLADTGIENLKKDFVRSFGDGDIFSVNKNQLTIKSEYTMFTPNYSGMCKFSPDNSTLKRIIKAVIFFEDGDICDNCNLGEIQMYEEFNDFNHKFETYQSKLTHIRFFKNGKIIFFFSKNEYAYEFFKLFNL